MEYSKYSKEEFEKAGLNSPEARLLADELQEDVLNEIHQYIEAAFINVITRLNSEGHDLSAYGELIPGEYAFRGTQLNENCCLRLACDVVISSGYSHISNE